MERFPDETPLTTPFDDGNSDDSYTFPLDVTETDRSDYLPSARRYPLASQAAVGDTYPISISPLPPEVTPPPDEIVHRLELDHVVKTPASFEDQCKDMSRTNLITYVQAEGSLAKATSFLSM
jgi:hypothetical protein